MNPASIKRVCAGNPCVVEAPDAMEAIQGSLTRNRALAGWRDRASSQSQTASDSYTSSYEGEGSEDEEGDMGSTASQARSLTPEGQTIGQTCAQGCCCCSWHVCMLLVVIGVQAQGVGFTNS